MPSRVGLNRSAGVYMRAKQRLYYLSRFLGKGFLRISFPGRALRGLFLEDEGSSADVVSKQLLIKIIRIGCLSLSLIASRIIYIQSLYTVFPVSL